MPQRHAATRRRGCPSRLGARVISPGPRGTRGDGAGRTFFWQKKTNLPLSTLVTTTPHTPARPPTLPQTPTNKTHPKSPTRARAHTQAPRAPNARGRAHTRARAQKAKKNSAIGTRTRVSWVKAKYDNHRGSETYGFSDLHLCPLFLGGNSGVSAALNRRLRAADCYFFWKLGF